MSAWLRPAFLQVAGGVLQGVGAALQSVAAAGVDSLDLFAGRWDLNLLFFGVVGLLAYALLAVAPRQ